MNTVCCHTDASFRDVHNHHVWGDVHYVHTYINRGVIYTDMTPGTF